MRKLSKNELKKCTGAFRPRPLIQVNLENKILRKLAALSLGINQARAER